MQTKSGKELNSLGRVDVNGMPFFVVALPHPKYVLDDTTLTKYVLVSVHEFDINNGIPSVEFA